MTDGLDYSQGAEALIVALARTGDRAAFAELVRRRQSWVRHLLRRCCSDDSLADDLAQQTFLRAWQKLGQLREPAAFGAWLKRLAVNAWLEHLRARDVLGEAAALDERTEVATRDVPGLQLDLASALGRLPPAVRTCVVLAYHEGYSQREIASLTGLPLGTVKSHIRRGSERMLQFLEGQAGATPRVEERVR